MVLEGFRRTRRGIVVHVNDPANGHRVMPLDEFDGGFTGVVLDLTPGPNFSKEEKRYQYLPLLCGVCMAQEAR